ncbi:MAG: Gfo/Idh/MocA family oxidoreductase [Armatimonadetes bacterium]|nr:Gfo/Idh/MocA family oxidoreductase [Armatimonadota bacterium]
MLRVGFIDHHLDNFHANTFLRLLHEELTAEGVRVVAAWESHPVGGDWCAKHGVERKSSIAEVVEAVDALMVLAPDNLADHLALCEQVLPAGKPTFIDKLLSPRLSDAQQILEAAQRYGTSVTCSSALRFAVELEALRPQLDSMPVEAFARGMGEWMGYGVHTIALVIGLMGTGVTRVADVGTPSSRFLAMEYADGRRATVEVRDCENMWNVFSWTFGAKVGNIYYVETVKDYNGFYLNLMKMVVRFFKTGESPVSLQEALEIVRLLEASNRSQQAGGAWVSL